MRGMGRAGMRASAVMAWHKSTLRFRRRRDNKLHETAADAMIRLCWNIIAEKQMFGKTKIGNISEMS